MARRSRLKKFIDDKQKQGFSWGENNCCFFAGEWARKCGYPDFTEKYKGFIKDKLTAAKRLRETGDRLVRNIPDKYLKRTIRPEVGDIALGLNQYNLGIYAGGGYSFFFDGINNCIRRVPNKAVKTFWRLP